MNMKLAKAASTISTFGRRSDHAQEVGQKWALRAFYLRKPPWDSGIPAPELVAELERPDAAPPGRALDLGCGTGTNAIYLAQHGWDTVGVDLIGGAIRRARRRAASAGARPLLLRGDVTRLENLAIGDGFSLLFDLSCYCGIPTHRRDAYVAGLTRVATPGARLLMFGYAPGVLDDGEGGVTAEELRTRFTGWELVDTTPGTNPFPTSWFTLRRR